MTTLLILAPVGAGKTAIVLERLTAVLEAVPMARVWAILASKRQENAFRQRLVEHHTASPVFFNVEFFNFYQLYQRILDMHGEPERDLSDTARFGLLRVVITELKNDGKLPIFASIAETQGFIRIIADFIFELKQSRVVPEDFSAVAQQINRPKDRELARIYDAYQRRLQQYNLADIEGQGWLAVEYLRKSEALAGDVHLIVVDGFDQFTPVQADLLALLADRADDTLITLTAIPVSNGNAGQRFERARQTLVSRLQPDAFHEEMLPAGEYANRHPQLQHLIAQIFRKDRQSVTYTPQTQAETAHLAMIEAPEPTDEVAEVMRRVKRLLLDGESPEEILIVLRDWGRYYVHFLRYRDAYELPMVLHYGQPLAENPAIDALMRLLSIARNGFRRRDVLDALRSPYFAVPALNDAETNVLEQVTLKFLVTMGAELWIDAIFKATHSYETDERDDNAPPLIADSEFASNLAEDLTAFFDEITPVETATVAEYVLWIERIIGVDPESALDYADDFEIEMGGYTLDMIARVRDRATPPEIIARDLAALQEFKRVLRGMLTTRELMMSLSGDHHDEISWIAFLTDLQNAVSTASINARPGRSGQVLVTTAADARGLPHDHVFIVGLAEGVFPARTTEDPLYLDSERRELQSYNVPLLTQTERASDDGLFYELICLPRDTLTLSRPTIQNGHVWIESHLWRSVTQVFPLESEHVTDHRLGIGEVTQVMDAATMDEVSLAVANALTADTAQINPTVKQAYNWLLSLPYWSHININQQIEMGRISREPHNRYSGVLSSPELIAQVAQVTHPTVRWSASRLNDYGVCGFRFFAKRVLRLETLEEPEAGMTVLERGSLYHKILEDTYGSLQQQGIGIAPENVDVALEILHDIAQTVFETAPETFNFRVDITWVQEQARILRKLIALVHADFSTDSPITKAFGGAGAMREPYRVEQSFGGSKTLAIPLPNGDQLRLFGFIDRMDYLGDGRVIVLDYKSGGSGSGIPTSEMKIGRNFQMMVYLLAAKALLADEQVDVAGGAFWHINDRKLSGDIQLDDEGQEAIEQAKDHIVRYLERARAGDFAVQATKLEDGKCIRYCEFFQLCRVRVTNQYKQER